MLNSVLKRLNGSAADPAALRGALDQLARDREEALARVDELKVQRHKALLDDLPDRDIDKLEREVERAELRVERIDAADLPLRQALAQAEAKARADSIEKARVAYVAVWKRTYRAALEQLAAAESELRGARENLIAVTGDEGCASQVAPNVTFLQIGIHENIRAWIQRVDGLLKAPRLAPAPAVAPPRPAAQPASSAKREVHPEDHPAPAPAAEGEAGEWRRP